MDIDLPYLKSILHLPDDLVLKINDCIVPGALDREKIISAMCAIRMCGLATHRFSILSVGDQSEPLARVARLTADAFGYEVITYAYPSSADLETLASHVAACLLISIPEPLFGRSDLVLAMAERLPPGGTVFLASHSDIIWGSKVLPARALAEDLQDMGLLPAQIEYYALFQKPIRPVARPVSLTSEEQGRCLFVLGHARSGSSPVAVAVSADPDCMMTFEANWYMPVNRRYPVEQFNLQRRLFGRRLTKTHFVPPSMPAAASVEDLFRWGIERYQWFGDKIAVSVREKRWDMHPATLAFDYQMRVFPAARYLLTFREPREAILAQLKIKPGYGAAELVNWWTTAACTLMSLLNITDRAALLPFDWLKRGNIAPIEALTGRVFDHPTFQFSPSEITTDQGQAAAYWSEQAPAVVVLVDEARDVYEQIVAQLNPETGRLVAGSSQGDFEDALIRLNAIAERADVFARVDP